MAASGMGYHGVLDLYSGSSLPTSSPRRVLGQGTHFTLTVPLSQDRSLPALKDITTPCTWLGFFNEAGITLCQCEDIHQIIMSFLLPVVCLKNVVCGLQKGAGEEGGGGHRHQTTPLCPCSLNRC